MTLHFYLRYRTAFGQQIYIVTENLGDGETNKPSFIPMQYTDDEYWEALVELPEEFDDPIYYYYVVKNEDGMQTFDGEEGRFVEPAKKPHNNNGKITIIDTWTDEGNINNVYFTKAFNTKRAQRAKGLKVTQPKAFTHEFRVKAPMVGENETVCLVGSTSHLKSWDTNEPVLMKPEGQWFVARINLDKNEWPASYKYGVFNYETNEFVKFEEGENRILRSWHTEHGNIILHEGFINLPPVCWKGTGVNIPVFSLRSKKSFGVGEFTDLRLLINWCNEAGIKMIQLLPINDTSAEGNWHDSYPYAAISAFALHPIYINLEKVAGKKHSPFIKQLTKKQKQLNSLQQVDYEQIIKFKTSALKELYELQKDELENDPDYFEFFDLNRHWLVPYAAFCYLKERYRTADFTRWKKHTDYDESEIQKLASPSRRHYPEIAIHYFVQYHLHKQLQEAVTYANRKGIVLKGDLPIGIYRFSCDAWVEPLLYNMNEQAGAPPDDFSAAGQNWGFPTYNWRKMKENGFKWWRSRFDQLGKYFDTFRIDHILGFFRIWSIPVESIEGSMGRFVPAIPVDISEFGQNNIYFDYNRYCRPYITEGILDEIFGDDKDEVIESFLDNQEDGNFVLKDNVNTQKKALQYLTNNGLEKFKQGVFDLITNVILFEEKDSGGTKFHFRIDATSTPSFRVLDEHTKRQLQWLYHNYFYERQNYFWKKEALEKLPQLKRSTEMLVCGEDLGMVPASVPQVMRDLGILSLNVQRMPKALGEEFFNPASADYLSIVQPSTHDMSSIREWWTENRKRTQRFYNEVLLREGNAPDACTTEIVEEIILQHLRSPAMWSVFLLQDLLAMFEELRADNPADERINNPANPHHYWRYRMPVTLEDLIKNSKINSRLQSLIKNTDRL